MIYRGFEIIREAITQSVGNMTVDSDSDSVYFGGRRLEVTQPTAGHSLAKHVIDVLIGQGVWPDIEIDGAVIEAPPDTSPTTHPVCGTCARASFSPDTYLGSCARGFTVWQSERACPNYENQQRRKKK